MSSFQDMLRQQQDEHNRKTLEKFARERFPGSSLTFENNNNDFERQRQEHNRDFEQSNKEFDQRFNDAVKTQQTIGAGVIIGIIIFALIALLGIIACICVCIRRQKQTRVVGGGGYPNYAGGYQVTQYSTPQTPYPGGAYPSYSYGGPQGSPPPYYDPSATPSPATIPVPSDQGHVQA